MTDTSTEAVLKLLEGVTPGPWWSEWASEYVCAYDPPDGFSDRHTSSRLFEVQDGKCSQANCNFVIAARDLVPALLAERDALRAELKKRA